jgi:MscS family membrane protein
MNDFLDSVWLNNSMRMYLIVAATILFVIIIKKYVAHVLAGLIFELVKRTWKDVDKKTFTNLVTRPLGIFLVILVSVITLHKLRFPEVLDVELYRITLKQLVHTIASILIVVSFIRLLLKMIDFIAIILHLRADRLHDASDNQLVVFFKDFFKVVISVIGLLMILKFAFGLDIGNLLTGLSIVGAAIALALRESLENLIASFIIFFDKPFSMGDIVKVHNFTGTVEKIGLRSTRIRTDQKTYITVPNKQMVDSILDNLSLRTQRRGDLRIEVGPSATATLLDRFVKDLRKLVDKPEVENSTVVMADITPTAIIITIEYYTGPITFQDYLRVKESINFGVLKLMEELQLEVAGASMDVKIVGEQKFTSTN